MEVVTGEAAKAFMDSSKNFLGQETWALKEGLEEQGYLMMEGLLNPAYAAQNASTLRWTYFIICAVLVVLAIPMFYYGFKHTKERVGVAADGTIQDKPNSFSHNLKLLFKNKELLLIVLSGILGGARMVYTYTGGLYFCKYALQNESAYSMLTMLVIPGGLVASVLTPWMTKKFSKKTSYIATHILGAVAMVIMFFMWDFKTGTFLPGGLVVSIVCMILLGIPQGINNIMTYAMIGDTVDYLEWKTGERGEGICFAMQTLINKIGMAVGAFIGVLAYAMAGISPSNPEGSMTIEGLNKLWMMLVLSGAVSFIACIIPMLFYTISEDKQRKMVAEIAAGTNPGAALKQSAEAVEA
jgi:Na+/melibiose symporter-like transporter